jgi:hypothetical protein
MTPELNSVPNDAGIASAFLAGDAYLGDPLTVEAELRLMLADILTVREARQSGGLAEAAALERCNARMELAARVLLGEADEYKPVIGWNQPGGVDEHLAKELNLAEADPVRRLILAQWLLVKEICQLVRQEEDGMPTENTRWQMDAAIGQHTKLLLGLPMDKPGPEDE